MAVRLKDVALAAGVSDATVSLALAGSPRISAATREKVEAVARELGYRPNAAARALRTEETRMLGLIVSDVANPFFAELAGEIQRTAAAEGYSVMLCNSDEDAGHQDSYLANMLAGSQVDAVMLVPAAAVTPGILAAGRDYQRLVLLDRPVVVSGRSVAATHLRQAPVIRSDASRALAEAADMLARLGHRRVGIVSLPLDTAIGRDRLDAIRAALARSGVPVKDTDVVAGDFRQGSGERAITELLASPQRPTAVIAADGLMTVGVLKGLRRAGLRVPLDVSVISFDDAPWFELFDPPLTTVAQPVAQLASAAVETALALIRGQQPPPQQRLRPPCTFVIRGSCGIALPRDRTGSS